MSRRSILLRALLAFVVLNAAIAAALQARWLLPARYRPLGDMAARVGLDRLAGAYPELTKNELASFLAERARVNRWEYEAFTEFRQVPVRGRFINVSELGFRLVKNQGPWPPDRAAFNVFFFGGSTTFGDGLPDGGALPSAFQEALPEVGGRRVRVYDFARPGYYSTQERILFEQLLLARVIPDFAVFVDGANETIREVESPERPRWSGGATERLALLVEEVNGHRTLHALSALAQSLSVTRAGLKLLEKGRVLRPPPLPSAPGVAERWLANRRMTEAVARRFSVPVLFAWQPIAVYEYDLSHHLTGGDFARLAPMAATYVEMKRLLAAHPEDRVLWLADIQKERRENLYVDEVHYTARFSKELAGEIVKGLLAEIDSEQGQPGLEGGGAGR